MLLTFMETPKQTTVPRPARPSIPGVQLPNAMALSMQKMRETLAEFSQLAEDPDVPTEKIDTLAQRLIQAGYKHELAEVLGPALQSEKAHPHLGVLWIQRLVTSHSWNRTYPDFLDDLCARGEIGKRAVLALLEYVNQKPKPALVGKLVSRHRSILKNDAAARSLAAAALAKAGLYSKAIRYTSGPLENLDARALHARAMAYRELGRERKAARVIKAALAQPEILSTYPILGVWYAMEEALAGNSESAAATLNKVRTAGWDEDELTLYYLARGVTRVLDAPREDRVDAFYAAFDRVHDRLRHRRRIYRRPWSLRRAYRRCVWKMAMKAGLLWRGLQAVWESSDSFWTLLALLIIPPLQLFVPVYLFRLVRCRSPRPHRK